MKKTKGTYSGLQLASALCMIIALLWLTISAPFVLAAQQLQVKYNTSQADMPLAEAEEEAANPFGNTTEEKSPTNSSSFSEEYLHDHHKSEYFFSVISQHHKNENAGTYIAFHGELLVPPPNIA